MSKGRAVTPSPSERGPGGEAVTIFTRMSALAVQHDAINLGQGFPDFPVDARLGELVYAAIRDGYNQYAPMAGLPVLRAAIAEDFRKRHAVRIDADAEVTITPGATYAIYTAFASILSPGDEAILLEPAYDSYIPNIRACGAVPVPVALSSPDFSPDWETIAAAITRRTRAIIVNTPHNPTGAVWTTADWDSLAEIIRGEDITVLADEVYEQLVFDGRAHHSVLQHDELRQKSFALYSFGKSLHATGWKMGYCIAPPHLARRFRQAHQYLAFSVNAPMQKALADYLELPQPEAPAMLLQAKRDYFLALLKKTPFEIATPAAGSYFQVASYRAVSDRSDDAFADWLVQEKGVATIPVSAFYSNGKDEGLLRFCFAKKEATLDAAMARLTSF